MPRVASNSQRLSKLWVVLASATDTAAATVAVAAATVVGSGQASGNHLLVGMKLH